MTNKQRPLVGEDGDPAVVPAEYEPKREAEPSHDGDDTKRDFLRGGGGERGTPTDPPTNDDPLLGGSGQRG